MRSRWTGNESSSETAAVKLSTSSARTRCSRSRYSRPSAPSVVDTTGVPAAHASSEQRNDGHLCLRDNGNGVFHKSGNLDVRIAKGQIADRSRVLAQDLPFQ